MGDAIEAVLGALQVISGYSWCTAVMDHLEWGDVNAILHGLEHSLLIYSMPPSNRKDTKSRPCPYRGQDIGVMEWYEKLPEPVFQVPSEGDEGGMYCGSFRREHVERDAFNALIDEVPVLGKTEEEDVVMEEAKDGQEGSEGLSPDPDYGSSPEPQDEGQRGEVGVPSPERLDTSGDKDVEMEAEPQAMTPRKRKLAEYAGGILSTDNCPVCHTQEHNLVDCPNPEAKSMVRLLKDIAEGKKNTPSDDSKKASSSSASGASKEEKTKKVKEMGTPKRERSKAAPPELVRMTRWRPNPMNKSSIGAHDRTCLGNPEEGPESHNDYCDVLHYEMKAASCRVTTWTRSS